MKMKASYLGIVLALVMVCVTGCAQKPESASSSEAIQQAKTMESIEAQKDYLIKEANAFVNSEQFDEAIKVAKYVLSELDKSSQEAKGILEKAQAELKAVAEKKAAELKEEMSKKVGNLGQ